MEVLIEKARNVAKIVQFVFGSAGEEYGVGRYRRWRLLRQVIRNNKAIKSLSTWQQHLMLVDELLRIPDSLKGDVVECGCFNGASTASLSLACALTNRRLLVCDSFTGLSEPTGNERYEVGPVFSDYLVYQQGDYSADDGLEGVKRNVATYGKPEVCTYVKGYFADTLPQLDSSAVVMVFEDADLPSAVEDCLRHLWPKLQEGCKFFCHEPWSVNVVALFYNAAWWKENLGLHCPGFFGSGDGVVPGMGFARKFDPEKIKKGGKELHLQFEHGKDGWEGRLRPVD